MHEVAMFVAVSVLSAVVGYLAVRFLLRFPVNHSLHVFAYYRFASQRWWPSCSLLRHLIQKVLRGSYSRTAARMSSRKLELGNVKSAG